MARSRRPGPTRRRQQHPPCRLGLLLLLSILTLSGYRASCFHVYAPRRPSLLPRNSKHHLAFEPLDARPSPTVIVHDWSSNLVPYQEAWDFQKAALEARASAAGAGGDGGGDGVDRLILLQHPPTYTLGTGSTLGNVLFDPSGSDAPADVFRIERGGEVTFHGPGQIVMYPIINLKDYRADLHWYLRALEEVVIRAIARLGLEGEREEGLTGVWVGGRKVSAVGVRVRRWVSMHGLALNVDPPMEYFRHIVPCGIADRRVVALRDLVPGGCTVEQVSPLLREAFQEVFGASLVEDVSTTPPEIGKLTAKLLHGVAVREAAAAAGGERVTP